MMPALGLQLRGSSAAWRANEPFFIAVMAYAVAVLTAAAYWHIPIDLKLYSQPFLLVGFGVTAVLLAVNSRRAMLERPKRLLPALLDQLAAKELPNRLITGLPVVFVLPVFFSLFTSVKGGLNRIVPFYADTALIAIDRRIHGGVDAWQMLHPLLGFGPIIFILNSLYDIWFVVMFIVLFCVTFSTVNEWLRSQYLVAFVLVWALLGNFVASMFASVGPAFVMPIYGDATFSPLMSYLQTINAHCPVWALRAQALLYANSVLDGPRLGSGISAFPSLHVAIATLNAIYLWRFGGLLRWLGAAFLVVIQLGAVQLGWHYGIDGYASMLATPIIWVTAGRISGRRKAKAEIVTPSYS